MRLRKLTTPICAATLALVWPSPATHAQEVYSQIVGAIALNVPASSDLLVAFPFNQSASFRGLVSSVSGTTANVAANALTAGSFNGAGYYLLIESGALKGLRIDIATNTESAITTASSLAGLVAGDTVAVVPHWTLASAFPNGVASHAEAQPGIRTIEVILPEKTVDGGGLAVSDVFYYANGAWRKVGTNKNTSFNAQILKPGSSFIIRNNGTAALTSYFFGEVVTAPLAIPLVTSASNAVDNFVSIERPLDISLGELGLHSTAAFQATTDSNNPTDLLLVYSLTAAGKNKSPAAQYYYFNNAWRKVGASASTDFSTDKIKPGMSIAIRKAQAGQNGQVNWINQWSLPQ